MSITIQPRRNTAAAAAASNPVLAVGELGFETDTGKTKRGDGVTAWNVLPYLIDTASANATYLTRAGMRPTVLLVGDSITAQCGMSNLLDVADAYSARGFFNWANWLMGERYSVVAVRGVGGEQTSALAARISTELTNYPSEWVVVEESGNDVAADRTFAAITTDLTTILNAIDAAGRKCCIVTTWPSNSYSTTSRKQIAAQVSQWIAALPLTRKGLVVADAYSVLVDPATGMANTPMTFDNIIHPGSGGAYRVGVQVANAMRPYASPAPLLRYADTDALVGIGNQSMLTNGAGWALQIGTAGTYTRDPDGIGNLATATVAAGGVQWSYAETFGPRIHIGDRLQMRARFRWSGLTWSAAMRNFSPYMLFSFRAAASGSFNATNNTFGQTGTEPSSFESSLTGPDVAASGDVTLTSTKFTLPATAADASAIDMLYAQLGFRSTNLSGGTVTVSGISVSKV